MPAKHSTRATDQHTSADSLYDMEHLPGAPDGDPEGSRLIGEVIIPLQALCQSDAYTTFDYELRDKDGRAGGIHRGPTREIAVAYSDSGRQVNVQAPRSPLTEQRWYEVIFHTANRHEHSAGGRFTDADEVLHRLAQWLTLGARPPRRFTHADVLAHITDDCGDGFHTAIVDLEDQDTTWAPGTTKKALTGTGRYIYQISASGCWVIEEPNLARLVPLPLRQFNG